MADFCRQCSVELFDADAGDLRGVTTDEEAKQGLYAVVLCEGCGPCQVTKEGICISSDCLKRHGEDE